MSLLSRTEAARFLACSPRHFDAHIRPHLPLVQSGGLKRWDTRDQSVTGNLALRRCAQCWKDKPIGEFIGKRGKLISWCSSCQERRGPGGKYTLGPRRLDLPTRGALRVTFKLESQNRKLGGIPCSITSAETCPPTCGLFGKGCYAEFSYLRSHWARTSSEGLNWRAFCREVSALPEGQLWRHNEAGDLPGAGVRITGMLLDDLVRANKGRRGFTFTHKPMTAVNRELVRKANAAGFVINLSADSLEQADQLAELGVGPVAVVLSSSAPERSKTPAGRTVVTCLAETRGLTCASCQLCAVGERKSVVGFRAHGQLKRSVNQLATLHRSRSHNERDLTP